MSDVATKHWRCPHRIDRGEIWKHLSIRVIM
jgi:hypothetical protein